MNTPYNDPGAQRPDDSFTAQDAARLFALFEGLKKEVSESITLMRGQVTNMQASLLNILDAQSRIESGLNDRNVKRLEAEVREAEIEVERAESARRAAEEKLSIKKDVKVKTIDTQENIRTVAASVILDVEGQKKAEREAFYKDLYRGALKYVVNGLAMGGTLGILGFLYWLFQLYINRGSP